MILTSIEDQNGIKIIYLLIKCLVISFILFFFAGVLFVYNKLIPTMILKIKELISLDVIKNAFDKLKSFLFLQKNNKFLSLSDSIIKRGSLQEIKVISLGKVNSTKQGLVFCCTRGILIGFALSILVISGAAYCIYKSLNKIQKEEDHLVIPDFAEIQSYNPSQISQISSKSYFKQCQNLSCPITHQLMREPCSISCGHQFQKSAIQLVIKKGNKMCPICRKQAKIQDIRPLSKLKNQIEMFRIKVNKKRHEWAVQKIKRQFGDDIQPDFLSKRLRIFGLSA